MNPIRFDAIMLMILVTVLAVFSGVIGLLVTPWAFGLLPILGACMLALLVTAIVNDAKGIV